MPLVYRLVKTRYADIPLDGASSKQFGGRWNSRGVAIISTADSPALAALEILVHIDTPRLLGAYTLVMLDVPDGGVSILADDDLPPDWQTDPPPASAAAIGDEWIGSRSSLALSVRSTVIPRHRNILLNPHHPDFAAVRASARQEPFVFDPRLGH